MKNEKKQLEAPWRVAISHAVHVAQDGAKRYARPVLSGFLALTMVIGSVPAPAYAEMMREAARSIAVMEKDSEGDSAEEAGVDRADGEVELDASAAPSAEEGSARDAAVTLPEQDGSVPIEADGTASPAVDAPVSSAASEDLANEGAPAAQFVSHDALMAATVSGSALASRSAMVASLQDAGASVNDAADAADAVVDGVKNRIVPVDGAGESTQGIAAAWLSEGDVASSDPDQLILQPTGDAVKPVRIRLVYAFSGEHEYKPGDVTIVVPAAMFEDRSGEPVGEIQLAVPAEPVTAGGWNYRLVNVAGRNEYHITNTHRLNAVTQGFIDLEASGVDPESQVDMKPSKPFDVRLEIDENDGSVTTHQSNAVSVVFDTHATLLDVSKGAESAPRIVSAGDPSVDAAHKAFPDAKSFLVVDWYMDAQVDANQPFNLAVHDELQDGCEGVLLHSDASADGGSIDLDLGNGVSESKLHMQRLSSAYPLEQFTKGETYSIENKAVYTLQEFDPLENGDPKPEQRKERVATMRWTYKDAVFSEPDHAFSLGHIGNDNAVYQGSSYTTHVKGTGTAVGDLSSSGAGSYGVYGGGLNDLREGKDIDVSYTLETNAILFPYTYQAPSEPVTGNPQGVLGNYGKKNVAVTVEAKELLLDGAALKTGEDFEYANVMLPMQPRMRKAVPCNLNEDGTVDLNAEGDGHFEYHDDWTAENVVSLTIEIQTKDEPTWHEHATAQWMKGELEVSFSDGTVQGEGTVPLPEGTIGVRIVASSSAAGFEYFARVGICLKATPAAQKAAEAAHKGGKKLSLDACAKMSVHNDQGERLHDEEAVASDFLMGFADDMRATMESSVKEYSSSDVDKENKRIKVTFTSKLHKRSAIEDVNTYERALESGKLLAERTGVWYDLLPAGMTPIPDSVKLREGDSVIMVNAIDNFRDTGRTLLVVEADLEPVAREYKNGDVAGYEDVPEITFDAWYGAADMADFGREFHNVAAFRSGNEELGNIDGYRGETDDPRGTQNKGTSAAFQGESESVLDALTDIDGKDDGLPTMVYAGATGSVDPLEYGNVGLTKEVAVNGDGVWSTGNNGSAVRNVYGGASYVYRLSVSTSRSAAMKGIVFYDTLENYIPGDDADPADKNAPRWRGTFDSIDVSQLEALGVKPVVYYSTAPGLEVSQGDASSVTEVHQHTDLNNAEVWTRIAPAELNAMPREEREKITAIAIDARRNADGTEFVLKHQSTISAFVYMEGPDIEAAEELASSGARAFNCVHLASMEKAASASEWGQRTFAREGYTSVGVVPYELSVSKEWHDENDRDGIRPQSVAMQLVANGVDVPGARVELSEANGWTASFGARPYIDHDGNRIAYTVREDPEVEGYRSSVAFDGERFTVSNEHDIARTTVSGRKTWQGDNKDVRPRMIEVELLANGTKVDEQTVRAPEWEYAFEELPAFEAGAPIDYTVREKMSSGDYVSRVEGTTIINTCRPYGDVLIAKTLNGGESFAATQDFTFRVVFARNSQPVFDKLAYEVTGAGVDPSSPVTGTISTDEVLTIRAGQTARIRNVPSGLSYTVEEVDVPAGYEVTSGAVRKGVVAGNADNIAMFVNEYHAKTNVYLHASKRLTGRRLEAREFAFELRDAEGNLVRTAANGKPGDPSVDAQGDVVTEAGVRFGALQFTDADNGKEFVYTMREADSGIAGMQYSDSVYTVRVTPRDLGDGTMTADVVYEASDGAALPTGVVPMFENVYMAEGKATMRVHKKLKGGDLAAGQFAFDLDEVVTREDGSTSLVEVEHGATNASDGAVCFTPIAYTQRDIGTSRLYAIHEVDAGDANVRYDEHYALVRVDVSDNGNGSLGVDMKFDGQSCPCFVCGGDGKLADGSACAVCEQGEILSSAQDFTFVNAMGPSGLDIQKTWAQGAGTADPKHKFEFELELTNEQGDPVDGLDFTGAVLEPVTGDTTNAYEASMKVEHASTERKTEDADRGSAWDDNPLFALGAQVFDALGSLFAPEEAYAAEAREVLEGNEGTWHWSIDTVTGVLTIGGTNIQNARWYSSEIDVVTSVVFESGSVAGKALGGNYGLFEGLKNLEAVDFTNLDTTQATSIRSLFEGCRALKSITWASFDTSNVTDMRDVFNGCRALTELDLSHFDTSKTTNMSGLFRGCSNLMNLVYDSFDMQNVTNVTYLFDGCAALTSIDLSPLASCRATGLGGLLSGCASLRAVDLKPLSPLAPTVTASMFAGCSSLKTIDLSPLNTSNVTSMGSMFSGCSGLESLDLSKLDTSKVTNMSSMFSNCTGSAAIDLSPLDTSKVTSMSSMFRGANLDLFDLSHLDFSSVTNVSNMFSNATKSTSFALEFGAPNITRIQNMFAGTKIASIDLTLRAPKVTDASNIFLDSPEVKSVSIKGELDSATQMYQLFSGCSALKSVDLSQLKAPKLQSVDRMFRQCAGLTTVELGGLTSSSLNNIDEMFLNCFSLQSVDLSALNTANVRSMEGVFKGCEALETLDLSTFDFSQITSYRDVFSGCSSLKSISFPEQSSGRMDTTIMFDSAFKGCSSLLEIDLSFLGHVFPRNMYSMFEGCAALQKLDLSSIDTSRLSTAAFVFGGCANLSSMTLPDYLTFGQMQLPDTPAGVKWTRVDADGNPVGDLYTSAQLKERYPGCGVGTYQWNTFTTLKFDLNGAVGSAADRAINWSADVEFSTPEAVYPDHRLIGWKYAGEIIPVGKNGVVHLPRADAQRLFQGVSSATLVAQWEEVFEIIETSRGVYRFKIPAGYVLHLPDVIPSGTGYTVRELDEAGYALVESTGTAGEVSSADAQRRVAAFVNAELDPGVPDQVRAEVRVAKMLDGVYAQKSDGFTFTMIGYDPATGEQGDWEAAVADGGSVSFPALSFDEADLAGEVSRKFEYEIREIDGAAPGIEYDASTIIATVTLEKGEDGPLTSSIAYSKDGERVERPAFSNKTKPSSIAISKKVEGAAAPATPFSFQVLVNGTPYGGTYSVDGSVDQAVDGIVRVAGGQTAHIDGLAAGSSYTVEEVDLPAGWKLTGDAPNKNGQLAAGETASLSFTNSYGFTAAATVQLMAYKSFVGGNLADGMFTFDLYEGASVAGGSLVGSAVNGVVDHADQVMGPDGAPVPNPHKGMAPVYFGELAYTAPGTHEYSVVERVPADAVNVDGVRYAEATSEQRAAGGFVLDGIVYDSSEHHATVTVLDNGDGTLACDVSYEGDAGASTGSAPVFENESDLVGFELIKEVTTELPASSPARDAVFTFDILLKDAGGASLRNQPYRVIAADGSQGDLMLVSDGGTIELRAGERAVFSELPFGASYSVSERLLDGWSIDKAACIGELAGTLTAGDGTTSVTVANAYRAEGSMQLSATKRFDGDLVDGQFVFDIIEVRPGGERSVVGTARNKADGSIVFDELIYALEDVDNRFTYEVVERDLDEPGVVYDDTVYNLEVVPKDNGNGTLSCERTIMCNGSRADQIVFTNTRSFELPFTGGDGLQLVGAAVIALGCTLYLMDRRRRA